MTDKFKSNRLLALVPDPELGKLKRNFEFIELPFKQVLHEMNEPIEWVYFITQGVASIVKEQEDGSIVEVATAGPEGMVGIEVFLGSATSANRALIQIPGSGYRMKSDIFDMMLTNTVKLPKILALYTVALMNQMAQSAACNRTHEVDARCARWLLMTHDRVGGDSFPLTHEFLAQMLGVHRPTVSIAASMLQKAGLISYIRGMVTIVNRKGLEKASCDCYQAITREYQRLLK